jgi:hypothetical protein
LEESFGVLDVSDEPPEPEDEPDDDEEEPPSELVLDFASDPDEDFSPDSLLWAFFRDSEG